MKYLEYDNWKQATPPQTFNDFNECKCKACLNDFDISSLEQLNRTYRSLNERSLVCTECKEKIELELNTNLSL
jgi:hypothetical protein